MKIFIINLEKRVTKKTAMRQQASSLGLEVTFFNAVSGQDLSIPYVNECVFDYSNSGLSLPEVGCALSHLQLYKRIIDENLPAALIMEDDAVIDENLKTVIEALIVQDKPIVYLLSPPERYVKHKTMRVTQTHSLHRVLSSHGGFGYIITLQAARALYQQAFPIKFEVDQWSYFEQCGYINVYCLLPSLITHGDENLTHSDLEPLRAQLKEKRARYFRELYQQRPLKIKIKNMLIRLKSRLLMETCWYKI